ncbi:MAG: signal recognition particle protein [Nitrospiraceae bacterium]|nr:signal recognition particle protein [Nitrospiraceae bacterium]
MLESLGERLEGIFRKLKGRGLLKEEDIELALKEVRVALLEADVNFRVVKDFIQSVKEKATGKEVLESLTPGQQVVKIVHAELCELLGGSQSENRIKLAPNPPTVIMMIGLQGSGKTTTSAKLAGLFKREGRRPMLVAADLQRPAAIDQLITLGGQIDVPVHSNREPGYQGSSGAAALAADAVKRARLEGRDIVILDTAGRLHIDQALMAELKEMKDSARPSETLLVADAMTGQEAVNIARTFNEEIGVEGVVLTKMDGDARGGAALSIKSVTGKPIKYIGTGEKLDMLESFHPERIASRVLGMGDVLSLIEKTQSAYNAAEAERLGKKILTESFSFEDLRDQLRKVRSMGPVENLLNMIPGMKGKLKNVKVDESEFVKVEAIIDSMTKAERKNHNLLNGSRRRRIAIGSGTTVSDVNRVVKQYVEMKKMLRMFKGGKFRMPGIPNFR